MREKFLKYEEYQKTGIEWIGDIPSSWELLRLGSVFNERRLKVNDRDFPPLSVTKNGIVPQLATAAKSNDGDNRKGVFKGDFVINSRSDRKGSSGLAYQDGSVSLINIAIRPIKIYPKFSEYLLKSYPFVEEYYRHGRGIVADLWTTRYSEMKGILLPVPSKTEQKSIADFLDQKTVEIDNYIRLKEKTIELLEERKAAVINRAVTKGLDQTVEMKDSGIEWLGEIPAHWEVKKLKYITKNLNSRRVPIETSLRGKMNNPKYDYYGATGKIDKVEGFIFDETTLLIAEDGANLKMRNIKLIYKAEGKYWVNNHAHILKPLDMDSIDYIMFSLESYDYNPLITGAAQPKLTKSAVMNILMPVPPKVERVAIGTFMSEKEDAFREQAKSIYKQIRIIKEYKESLISAAVTGKIDVRNYHLTPEEYVETTNS